MILRLTITLLFTCHAFALWPLPFYHSTGDTVLWIDRELQVSYNGATAQVPYLSLVSQPLRFLHLFKVFPEQQQWKGGTGQRYHVQSPKGANATALNSLRIINTALDSMMKSLFDQQYIPWQFHPRHSDFEPAASAPRTYIQSISLHQTTSDPNNVFTAKVGEVDESYSINVTESGHVMIAAVSSIGIAHALTTFTQLFYAHRDGGVYTPSAPVAIRDKPVFQHRGLDIDVARSWYEPSDILRTIDGLAYNKFNRLHLHMTDSQSWPLEVPSMPELAEKGSYGPGKTYNAATLELIQEYAAVRGVQTVLEIDMPGHTSSVGLSHPELIAAFDIQPSWSNYSSEPPSGTMKLNSSAVSEFLKKLFDDVLPRVSPFSSCFHNGGDEVNLNAYTLDNTVKSNDPMILRPLMQAFINRNHDQIRAAGLTPVVWEEMLLTWDLELGSDVIVQTWQNDEAVVETVSRGHTVIAGNSRSWYLDCGRGQWLDFTQGEPSRRYWPYNDYCYPLHNWRMMYSYDPLQGVPENLTHLVIGAETHIWSEQTDPINLDRMVWPRACAAAEVLWSGAKDEHGLNRSQVTASPRLSDMRERLVKKGIMAEPVRMPYCTQNGTQCAL